MVARGCVKDGLKIYGDRVCEADDLNGVCNEANGVKVNRLPIDAYACALKKGVA